MAPASFSDAPLETPLDSHAEERGGGWSLQHGDPVEWTGARPRELGREVVESNPGFVLAVAVLGAAAALSQSTRLIFQFLAPVLLIGGAHDALTGGDALDIGEVWGRWRSRAWSVLGIGGLATLVVMGAALFLGLGVFISLHLSLGAAVARTWLPMVMLATLLAVMVLTLGGGILAFYAAPEAVLNSAGPLQALGRSWSLVGRNWSEVWRFWLSVSLRATGYCLLIVLPLGGVSFSLARSYPEYLQVFAALERGLGTFLVAPVSVWASASWVAHYLHIRRLEA